MDKGDSVMNCIFRSFRINGVPVSEQEFNEYKQQRKRKKENNMTDNKTETIPHLARRRQWLDDVEKDPKCVWRWSYKIFSGWNPLPPGVEPSWRPNLEYSPQPKTKTYYMAMVQHKNHIALDPFAVVFSSKAEIQPHLDSYALKQVGDIVPREVEQ